jgi:hypothetical protein
MRPLFSETFPGSNNEPPRLHDLGESDMKEATDNFEASNLASNLMLASAVVAAATPMLLGDRLVLIASSAMTQGTVLFQSLSISLQRLLS